VERHVPLDLPAQVGSTNARAQLVTTPTAKVISIASLPHAAKTYVPPPVLPLADPPGEPDLETEEHQPVMKPTKRQNPAQPSDEETLRPSCWDKAAESLQVARPDVYKKLQKIKSRLRNGYPWVGFLGVSTHLGYPTQWVGFKLLGNPPSGYPLGC
jgi:hypothetical protein